MNLLLKGQAGYPAARQFGLVFTIDEAVRDAYKQVCADLPRFNIAASDKISHGL
jgi:hypothetical protein